ILKHTDLTRELLSAITAADLLNGLKLGDALSAELASRLRAARQEAGPQYRQLKTSLRKLTEDPAAFLHEASRPELLRLLDRRRAVACKVGCELRRLETEGRLTSPLVEICH